MSSKNDCLLSFPATPQKAWVKVPEWHEVLAKLFPMEFIGQPCRRFFNHEEHAEVGLTMNVSEEYLLFDLRISDELRNKRGHPQVTVQLLRSGKELCIATIEHGLATVAMAAGIIESCKGKKLELRLVEYRAR